MPHAAMVIPSLLSMAEPEATALLLLIFGTLLGLSVLLSRTVDRIGVPIVLLFLLLGMVGGSEGLGRIAFDNFELAVRFGTVALVLILFDGGLSTSLAAVRSAYAPATVLATLGVLLTAGLLAVFTHVIGMPWGGACLLGAVVSSTDAAAVFSVLRGGRLQLRPRLGHTLELESCINDPMAVILTTAVISVLQSDKGIGWGVVLEVPLQLTVGVIIGSAIGYVGGWFLSRVRLTTTGLYPVLSLSMAVVSFGLSTVLHGSGFLAVFATGVVLGNRGLPFINALRRVHDAFGWLAQVGMFLMLGLLVTPSQLPDIAGTGLAVALFCAFVARPIAVWASLAPFRFPSKEIFYIGWNGLRGAVPIVLATFPVLAGVRGAHTVFNVVFFIVVINSLLPGATIRWITRRLKLTVPTRPRPSAAIEINSLHPLGGELSSFLIDHSVAVNDMPLSAIELPPQSSVVLLVRDGQLIAPRGSTRLTEGDHAFVYHRAEDRSLLELLFGEPLQS
ncbi:MAG: potassium/proton antiporter [Tepidisphaeraceae bacterium]